MIIVIQCKDQVGLVAAISGILAREQLNIISMREHVDTMENRFYMRLEIEKHKDEASLEKKLKENSDSEENKTKTETLEKFTEALADDLNTPKALEILTEAVEQGDNEDAQKMLEVLGFYL